MNYEQFLKHIEDNGVTKARNTEELNGIPKGTWLYFGEDCGEINTYDFFTNNLNKQFNYDFDYQWNDSWKDYKGKLILEESSYPNEDYEWLPVGTIVDISPKLKNHPVFDDWNNDKKEMVGKKGVEITDYIYGGYKINGWCIPAMYVRPTVQTKAEDTHKETIKILLDVVKKLRGE